MIDQQFADTVRVVYAVLAALCSVGFVATLIVRWDLLHRGERILRGALIGEHLTITYGAYVALHAHYPPTIVGLALSWWLLGVLVGFVVWIVEDLLHGDRDIPRLTH